MYTVQLITKCAIKWIYIRASYMLLGDKTVLYNLVITTLIVIHSGHNVGDFVGEFWWNSLVVHRIQPVKHIL